MPNDNNQIPTGLYWQGKRTEVERIALPFQTIETINESRATREKEKDTLLQVEDPLKKIKELLNFRKPFYEKADIMIDTEDKTPLQIAEEIIERIKDMK